MDISSKQSFTEDLNCDWQTPSQFPVLTSNTIHVWCASTIIDISSYINCLSPDERQRTNRFVHEKDRVRYAAGKILLRHLLARYLNTTPEKISFKYTDHKKPYIVNHPIHFNMSESHGVALLAFSHDSEVGVDIEWLQRNVEILDLAKRFFSDEEYQQLLSLQKQQQIIGFFNGWTRKEAFIKNIGLGLSYSLNSFSVNLNPQEPAKFIAFDEPNYHSWLNKPTLYHLQPKKDYIGALAIPPQSTSPELHCYRYDMQGGTKKQ